MGSALWKSSTNELLGLSVFLSWMVCVFFLGTIWPVAGHGWMGGLPTLAGMGLAGVMGLAGTIMLNRRRDGEWEWPSWAPWVAATACGAGTMILAGAATSESSMLEAMIACCVLGMGFALFVVLWGSRVSLLEGAAIELIVPIALALSRVVGFFVNLLTPPAAVYAVILLPFISALLYNLQSIPTPSVAAPPLPEMSLSACAAAAAILLAFRLWYSAVSASSTALRPDSELDAAVGLVAALVVFAAFVYAALSLARSVNVSLAVSWMLPILLTTLAFLHWNSEEGAWCVQVINNVLSPCSQAFFYILFAKTAGRNACRGVFLFLCFLTGMALGNSLGTAIGTQLSLTLSRDGLLFALSALAAVIGTLSFPLMRTARSLGTRLSPDAWLSPEENYESTVSTTPASDNVTAARAQQLAQRFDLSTREKEVLAYLLMGRNRPYIRDTLHISINTVNTHTKRIYAKLDVHSQQELIDLAYADTDDPVIAVMRTSSS